MIYNIFVLDDKRNYVLDRVELPGNYKLEFIQRFGLYELPIKTEFEAWLEYATTFDEIAKYSLT